MESRQPLHGLGIRRGRVNDRERRTGVVEQVGEVQHGGVAQPVGQRDSERRVRHGRAVLSGAAGHAGTLPHTAVRTSRANHRATAHAAVRDHYAGARGVLRLREGPMTTDVTVLGAGNTGFAAAANLTLAGHSVTLGELPAFADAIEPVREERVIELHGVAHVGRGAHRHGY